MEINEILNFNDDQVVYATIGAFDGVHLGHQNLISTVVKNAQKDHAKSLVVTFYPNPAVVLKSIPMPFYITSPQEKEEVFRSLGVDFILCLKFSNEMSGFSPEQFLEIILKKYPVTRFWLGEDFAMGKNRSGNINVLEEIGKTKGFSIHKFPHIQDNGEKISSSMIRGWVLQGSFPPVSKALNRYYSVIGNVMHGDARGRKLGFPTANIDIWKGKLLPSPGVYATWIEVNGMIYPSVTNVGVRPTFDNQSNQTRVETFIHDYSRDIYDNQVKLYFVEKTRNEKKFESIQLLIEQIQNDAKQSEEILKHANQPTGLFT